MTRDEEIRRYRAMREEATRRLKELRYDGLAVAGKARIARRQNTVYKQDEMFQLAYNVRMQSNYGQSANGTHFVTLFTGTRAECVEQIPEIVRDLNALYTAAKGGAE